MRDAAGVADALADALGELDVVAVAGREVGAGLGDADDRLARHQLLAAEPEVQVALEVEGGHVRVGGIVEPGARAQRSWRVGRSRQASSTGYAVRCMEAARGRALATAVIVARAVAQTAQWLDGAGISRRRARRRAAAPRAGRDLGDHRGVGRAVDVAVAGAELGLSRPVRQAVERREQVGFGLDARRASPASPRAARRGRPRRSARRRASAAMSSKLKPLPPSLLSSSSLSSPMPKAAVPGRGGVEPGRDHEVPLQVVAPGERRAVAAVARALHAVGQRHPDRPARSPASPQ